MTRKSGLFTVLINTVFYHTLRHISAAQRKINLLDIDVSMQRSQNTECIE